MVADLLQPLRKRQLRQPFAVVKRIAANGVHAVRNRNLRFAADVALRSQSVRVSVIIESIAQPEPIHAEAVVRPGKRNRRGAAERTAKLNGIVRNPVASRLQTIRNVDIRKPRAAKERLSINPPQPLRQHNFRQTGAFLERTVADGGNAVGNRDLRKRCAAAEKRLGNLRQSGRKIDFLKRCASKERVVFDGGNAFGNNHLFEIRAIIQQALRNAQKPIRQNHPRKELPALGKRAVLQFRHAVRHDDLRARADVFHQRQAVLHTVAVKGIAQIQIIAVEAVVRSGNRDRRGAAKVAAKLNRTFSNEVLDRLHSVWNFNIRQALAANKRVAADLLQPLRKRQLRQSFAVSERAIANRRNALRNRNLLQRRAAGKYIAFKFRKPRGQNHLRHRFAILKRGTCLRHLFRHRDLRIRSQIFVQAQTVPVALVIKEITHLEIARTEIVAAF